MRTSRRLSLFITFALSIIVVGLAPASAATPGKVDPVTFIGAGLADGKASLTVSWPAAANATKYEVSVSTSYAGVLTAPVNRTTSATQTTIGGLLPGTDYYVVVRGTNGSSKGTPSSRVGHGTILSQGAGDGPTYSVLTYNLCSQVASCLKSHPWEPRRQGVLDTIAAQHPDVLTLQESASLTHADANAVPGYTRVAYYSSKTLLLRTSRLSVVPIPGGSPATVDGLLEQCAPAADLRVGCIDMGGRYAVWAEVHDRDAGATGNVIFVDVHLSPGTDRTAIEKRRAETTKLVAGIAAINPDGLPVIMGGDFNSHKHRSDDSPATVLNAAGYTDAYDLAESLTQQHHNSYNNWKSTPTFSYTWGDHIDHVWVQAGRTRVASWANVAPLVDGKYKPLSSDHNPLLIKVQVTRSERLAGTDRYGTAVAVSRRAFPNGAPVVYVAGGVGFADGLSGGPLAAKDQGPLLLTPAGSAPSSVTAEIKRLHPARIVILGGPASISATVADALDAIAPTTRVSGVDRYATATSAAGAWPTADVVYLASGEAFPDALSGSALAASKGAPLLLTRAKKLPSVTADALDRLKPSRIVIIGGTAAVSDQVAETLAKRDGVEVTRVAGDDRYATSVKALTASGALASGWFIGASGDNFPDALAGTPAAHHLGAGFALTRPGCVPDGLADALGAQSTTESFVLGGTAALGFSALTKRCG